MIPKDQTLVEIKNLSKVFASDKDRIVAFQDIHLNISEGQFICIVGPSGCGKTTLLRTIANLETPTEGQLNLAATARGEVCEIRMIFQEQGLYPWMSVAANIAFTLQNNSRVDATQTSAIVEEYIRAVGLDRFSDLYPHQLSGGMRQRVSIARAFANQPDLLLMDEPFVFLDYQTRLNLQTLLMKLWSRSQQTVVFVTHDIEEAVLLADTVFVMSAHPGTIISTVSINLPRPRDRFELIKNETFLDSVAQIANLIKHQIQLEA